MPHSQAAGEHAFWKAERHPLVIEYSLSMLDEICSTVVEAFYCAPRGGVEVGGVLFGLREENAVQILASRPLACEYAGGPSYLLSPKDEAGLRELLKTGVEGLVPVGWFHSHTRSEILLSNEDAELFNRYFPEPWQVTLVLRPAKLAPTKAGFFIREAGGRIRTESSYREFSINPTQRTEARPPRAARERKPPAKPEVPRNPVDAPPIAPPAFTVLAEPPGPWKRIALVVGLLAILAGAGAAVNAFWLSGPPPNLALRLSDSNAHLRIEWDHGAKVIQEAQSATLEIGDGNDRRSLELDREQLHNGSVTFVRQGDNITVHLIVHRPGARPVEETALFLGQPVGPKQEGPARELESVRDQLRQEVTKSRDLERDLKALEQKRGAAKTGGTAR